MDNTELSNRESKKLTSVLSDMYTQEKDALLENLAEALDIEVEELPAIDVQIVATVGGKTVSVSGFEAQEKDDEDKDSLFNF